MVLKPLHKFIVIFAAIVFASPVFSNGSGSQGLEGKFELVILHNNDGESQLINAGIGLEDFGGIARFKTLVDKLRREAHRKGAFSLMLSSGDNFLPGPEFSASLALPENQRFYDSRALDLIGYDAMAIGNHEFDFGPDVLERFISDANRTGNPRTGFPFLSANLDFSLEPGLQALVDAGRIAGSTVVKLGPHHVGIIGLITPDLRFISSPRNTIVNPDIVGVVQSEVNRLQSQGINKIILLSHLQSISEEQDLAAQLSGVDVYLAGGGDELLTNNISNLIPGDEAEVFGPYPLVQQDADGNDVYLITTKGSYNYVGRLRVIFDSQGKVIEIGDDSDPVRVAGGTNPDAVKPDPRVQRRVVDPVEAFVADLAANIIGTSEVTLDGRRSQVRTVETNEGNLVADALLWQANQLAASFGIPDADIALQNGGGIRNDSEIPPGDITELLTFDILPFTNFVTIVPGIPAAQFKEILENAVSRVEFTDGRFAQVAGFSFTYDPAGTAQELDADGNVITAGTRVIDVTLDDGTVVVSGGAVSPGAAAINIATIDFLARGGDQYPYRNANFTSVGVTYQQALGNYITDALAGTITAADYPEGGEGRVTESGSSLAGSAASGVNLLSEAIPEAFVLRQNYPNPFNPATTIRYAVPQVVHVKITLFNLLGQKVATLINEVQQPGDYQITLNGSDLNSGVYFYRLDAGTFSDTRKMMIIK